MSLRALNTVNEALVSSNPPFFKSKVQGNRRMLSTLSIVALCMAVAENRLRLTPEKPENALDFLPEAMVDEMLKRHLEVVNNLGNQLRDVGRSKQAVREKLEQLGL